MSSPFLILGKEEPNMIVIMKPMTEQKEIDKLAESLTAQGVEVNTVYGKDLTILGQWKQRTRQGARTSTTCLLYTSCLKM